MNKVNLIIRALAVGWIALTGSLAGAQTLTESRSSMFEYNAATGLLSAEIVEPLIADQCVRTEYVPDPYGNRQVSTVKFCSGASARAQFTTRTTTATFATFNVTIPGGAVQVPAGTFATTVINAKGQSEARQYDPRFGALVAQTGPNGLTTSWQYDDFGRKVREIAPDGNQVVVRHCVLSGQGDISANSAGCGSPSAVPPYAISYVETQPLDSNGAISGPYSRKYSDALGRVIREETQGYDGSGQPGTARTIVKDTEYSSHGVAIKVTQPYFLENNSSLSAGSAAPGWTATDYDAMGRPTAVYTRDNEGSDTYQSATVAKATMTYNGLIVTQKSYRTSKNAQGQQQAYDTLTVVKTSNALGQLVEIKDSLNGTLRKRYDPFSNVIETQDAYDNRIVTVFDTRGRKKELRDPNAGTWYYDYDALGQLVFQRSPLQSVATASTMTYDVLGRMIARTEPEYSTTWSYDICTKGIGKLCQVATTNGQTKSFGYDGYGRLSSSSQTATATFTASTTYDSKGRVLTYTYPTGIQLTYGYTALGYLNQITRSGNVRVWAMGAANAWGKTESFDLGTDAKQNTRQTYDALTGRIAGIAAGDMSASVKDGILSQTYGWDTVGNLTDRSERYSTSSGSVLNENFGYDALNRLASYQTASPNLAPSISKTVTLTYDLIGNITGKSDVGAYTYLASGQNSVRPGAVQSVSGGAIGTRSYTYDNAGNMTAATGSRYTSLAYNSFNLPKTLGGAASTYAWTYGADHERVREIKTWSGNTRTTWYFHPDNANGLAFEQEVKGTNTPIYRHYVSAMGRTVLVIDTQGTTVAGSTTVKDLQYWHVDQLGSINTITDQGGSVKQRFSYDPFGKRRDPNGTYDAAGNLVYDFDVNNKTDRGFTGHEHLDDDGIINMNGRTYDPLIGRFMQSDPAIQAPDVLQNYNRYSYVLNNPLNATDPTGHFFQLIPIIFAAVGYEMTAAIIVNGIGMATCGAMTIGNMMIAAAVGGALGAAVAGGDEKSVLRAAFTAGISAAAFYGVGEIFGHSAASPSVEPARWVAKTIAHSAVGCAQSAASGERCRDGALGAGVSAGLGFLLDKSNKALPENTDPRLIRAVVGGVASKAGGGKFANGALSAAFQYMFNEMLGYSELQSSLGNSGLPVEVLQSELNTPRDALPSERILSNYGEGYYLFVTHVTPALVTEAALLRAVPYAMARGAPYIEELALVAERIGAREIAKALIVVATGAGGAGGKGALEAALQLLKPAGQIVQRKNEVSTIKKLGNVTSGTRIAPPP